MATLIAQLSGQRFKCSDGTVYEAQKKKFENVKDQHVDEMKSKLGLVVASKPAKSTSDQDSSSENKPPKRGRKSKKDDKDSSDE